ncbi:hypothetical protein CYMTET_12856 [Cymbomonas tetramitiformis]|uniref:WW domain-containing protein n=1 Tax=Cymbomonas tetramitiformis TaxID=36881 RepID=A0AAE0GJV5_9CHLO|nr:hypothetical protein CYMTET_12856 [Cymbomonas tetramitiformis]
MAPPGESIVLEEEIDENYEPTQDEILEYARWLGMDVEKEKELLWLAREGLKAPLPEHWKPCKSPEGEIYYFNFTSGESVWDHPCDEYYKKLYAEEKGKWEAKKNNPKQSRERRQSQVGFDSSGDDDILGRKSGGSMGGSAKSLGGSVLLPLKTLDPPALRLNPLPTLGSPRDGASDLGVKGLRKETAKARSSMDESEEDVRSSREKEKKKEPKSKKVDPKQRSRSATPDLRSDRAGALRDSTDMESSGDLEELRLAAERDDEEARKRFTDQLAEERRKWEQRLQEEEKDSRKRFETDEELRNSRWREDRQEDEKRQRRLLEDASMLSPSSASRHVSKGTYADAAARLRCCSLPRDTSGPAFRSSILLPLYGTLNLLPLSLCDPFQTPLVQNAIADLKRGFQRKEDAEQEAADLRLRTLQDANEAKSDETRTELKRLKEEHAEQLSKLKEQQREAVQKTEDELERESKELKNRLKALAAEREEAENLAMKEVSEAKSKALEQAKATLSAEEKAWMQKEVEVEVARMRASELEKALELAREEISTETATLRRSLSNDQERKLSEEMRTETTRIREQERLKVVAEAAQAAEDQRQALVSEARQGMEAEVAKETAAEKEHALAKARVAVEAEVEVERQRLLLASAPDPAMYKEVEGLREREMEAAEAAGSEARRTHLAKAKAEVEEEKERLLASARREVEEEKRRMLASMQDEIPQEKDRQLAAARSEAAMEKDRQLATARSEAAMEKDRQLAAARSEAAMEKDRQLAAARSEAAMEKDRLLAEARSASALEKDRQIAAVRADAERQLVEARMEAERQLAAVRAEAAAEKDRLLAGGRADVASAREAEMSELRREVDNARARQLAAVQAEVEQEREILQRAAKEGSMVSAEEASDQLRQDLMAEAERSARRAGEQLRERELAAAEKAALAAGEHLREREIASVKEDMLRMREREMAAAEKQAALDRESLLERERSAARQVAAQERERELAAARAETARLVEEERVRGERQRASLGQANAAEAALAGARSAGERKQAQDAMEAALRTEEEEALALKRREMQQRLEAQERQILADNQKSLALLRTQMEEEQQRKLRQEQVALEQEHRRQLEMQRQAHHRELAGGAVPTGGLPEAPGAAASLKGSLSEDPSLNAILSSHRQMQERTASEQSAQAQALKDEMNQRFQEQQRLMLEERRSMDEQMKNYLREAKSLHMVSRENSGPSRGAAEGGPAVPNTVERDLTERERAIEQRRATLEAHEREVKAQEEVSRRDRGLRQSKSRDHMQGSFDVDNPLLAGLSPRKESTRGWEAEAATHPRRVAFSQEEEEEGVNFGSSEEDLDCLSVENSDADSDDEAYRRRRRSTAGPSRTSYEGEKGSRASHSQRSSTHAMGSVSHRGEYVSPSKRPGYGARAHRSQEAEDDVPHRTTLSKAKLFLKQQRKYIREKQEVIHQTRVELKASIAALSQELDPEQRERKRATLMGMKRNLEAEARKLNDDAHALRALKQTLHDASQPNMHMAAPADLVNEVERQRILMDIGGLTAQAANRGAMRGSLKSSLDAVSSAVVAAQSAASVGMNLGPADAQWAKPRVSAGGRTVSDHHLQRSTSGPAVAIGSRAGYPSSGSMGGVPSAEFLTQLDRFNGERDLAKDLLTQHSSWLSDFRSKMSFPGVVKDRDENNRMHMHPHGHGKGQPTVPKQGGMRVKLDKSKELVITIEDVEAAMLGPNSF